TERARELEEERVVVVGLRDAAGVFLEDVGGQLAPQVEILVAEVRVHVGEAARAGADAVPELARPGAHALDRQAPLRQRAHRGMAQHVAALAPELGGHALDERRELALLVHAARPPRNTRPGSSPVGSPSRSRTRPFTTLARKPSARWTRRRAPPGRSCTTSG